MSEPSERELSPEESLQLITRQQHHANRKLGGHHLWYWTPWGVTWLISFGLFFLYYGLDGAPYVAMPQAVPLIVLFSLMLVAISWTAFIGIRSTRHIQGASSTQGMMFGFTWTFGFLTVIATGIYFKDFIPEDQIGLLWAGLSVGVTGMLYMAGAAIFNDRSMFGLGLWISVVNAIGITAGPGWHALLTATAGGGGMLLVGLVLHMHDRGRS